MVVELVIWILVIRANQLIDSCTCNMSLIVIENVKYSSIQRSPNPTCLPNAIINLLWNFRNNIFDKLSLLMSSHTLWLLISISKYLLTFAFYPIPYSTRSQGSVPNVLFKFSLTTILKSLGSMNGRMGKVVFVYCGKKGKASKQAILSLVSTRWRGMM